MSEFITHGRTTCRLGPNDEVNMEIHGSLMPTEIYIEKDRCSSGAVFKVLLDFPRGAFKHPDDLFSPEGKTKLGIVLAEAYYQMAMDAHRAPTPGADEQENLPTSSPVVLGDFKCNKSGCPYDMKDIPPTSVGWSEDGDALCPGCGEVGEFELHSDREKEEKAG